MNFIPIVQATLRRMPCRSRQPCRLFVALLAKEPHSCFRCDTPGSFCDDTNDAFELLLKRRQADDRHIATDTSSFSSQSRPRYQLCLGLSHDRRNADLEETTRRCMHPYRMMRDQTSWPPSLLENSPCSLKKPWSLAVSKEWLARFPRTFPF